jgi:hypothetical protein
VLLWLPLFALIVLLRLLLRLLLSSKPPWCRKPMVIPSLDKLCRVKMALTMPYTLASVVVSRCLPHGGDS